MQVLGGFKNPHPQKRKTLWRVETATHYTRAAVSTTPGKLVVHPLKGGSETQCKIWHAHVFPNPAYGRGIWNQWFHCILEVQQGDQGHPQAKPLGFVEVTQGPHEGAQAHPYPQGSYIYSRGT